MTVGLGAVAGLPANADASQSVAEDRSLPFNRPTLADAQGLFYSARYDAAAALALALRSSQTEDLAVDLAAYELRTSALLFQLKGALGDHPDKKKTFKVCVMCPELMAAFLSDTARGQALARARLRTNPEDEAALFFLGKIDLNYVWLQLGTLGRKTGWDQYWETRAVPRRGAQTQSTACSRSGRESMVRLRRRHQNAERHELVAWRRQHETSPHRCPGSGKY